MGRGDPLEDPELEAIERCLDDLDLQGAQARLATIGQQPEYADVAQYFVARLLFYKGRLDAAQVAERMQEVLDKVGYFPRAVVLLHEAQTGHLTRPTGLPPPSLRPSQPHRQASPPASEPRPPSGAQRSAEPSRPTAARLESDPAVAAGGVATRSSRASAPTAPRHLDAATAMAAENPLRSDPPGAYDVSVHDSDPIAVEARRMAPTEPRTPLRAYDEPERAHPPLNRRGRSYTPVGGMPAIQEEQPRQSSPAPRGYPDIPRGPRVPEFESNRAPPSYTPGAAVSEFDPLRHKGSLPSGAGRYSQRPDRVEEFTSRRPRGRPSPEPVASRSDRGAARSSPRPEHDSPRPTHRDPRREPSEPPPTRSPAPSSGAGAGRDSAPRLPWSDHPPSGPSTGGSVLPPLRELTAMMDEGQLVRVIAAVNRGGPRIPAEYALLRARALAGAGYADQAFDALAHLTSAPLIAPEVRAGCARLFVELGEPTKGLTQAIEALQEDPEGPLMRLTYALAAVRCSRRQPDEALLVKAERAIASFRGRGGAYGALARGLEASIYAGLGEADKAITVGEEALAADPKSVDALAALTEAYGRITRHVDARRYWTQLAELAPEEAEVLAVRLPQLQGAPVGGKAGSYDAWDISETALVDGKRSLAIETVEKLCEEYVARMTKSASQSGLTAMATVASTCFTRAPVLSCFAPYDLSLYSIERLEAALGVLYGKEPRARLRTDEGALRLLAGAYMGEAIRLAHGGRWEGRVSELQRSRVIVGEQYWYPFQAVSARLHSGSRTRLADGLRGALTLRGGPPWSSHIPNPIAPPVPWGRAAWPHPRDIARLGRSVMRSPVTVFCEQADHGMLDLSLSSLGAIDAYLVLLAPVPTPTHDDAAWARRIAVFVGGYVGEVLRDLVGGAWATEFEAVAATDFVLTMGRDEAHPVEWTFQRLTGAHERASSDYVREIARRAARGA